MRTSSAGQMKAIAEYHYVKSGETPACAPKCLHLENKQPARSAQAAQRQSQAQAEQPVKESRGLRWRGPAGQRTHHQVPCA